MGHLIHVSRWAARSGSGYNKCAAACTWASAPDVHGHSDLKIGGHVIVPKTAHQWTCLMPLGSDNMV